MPAWLEVAPSWARCAGRYAGAVTQVPETTVVEETARDAELAKRYHLILMDDNDHTYQYVIEMLAGIFGYGKEKALAIAAMVDTQGEAVVETAAHDRVTQHQRRIHGFGPDHRIEQCQGSMSAVVEEAS